MKENHLSLQQILKKIDEFTGYEADQENPKDHVIRETTWRKYVRLYNEFKKEEDKVKKIGNTKGTRYKVEDVNKVIAFNKKRIENIWFDKTSEGAEITQYYVQERKEIDKQVFMELIYEKRRESKELSEMPISKVAKIIGEERVHPDYYEELLFGKDTKKVELSSGDTREINREEELRFLSSFDKEAYETNLLNHAKLVEEEFDEFNPSSKTSVGSYTEFGVFHPELFMTKESLENIKWAIENDFWTKIKEEAE